MTPAEVDSAPAPDAAPSATPAESLPDRAEPTETVIEASRGWQLLNLRELWRYRELLLLLTWRDVTVRYKQTVLGVIWVVLQPLAMMAAFSLILARVGGIGDRVEHYPLFVVEKSHHPGNITVVYTKLDPNCRVLPDRAHAFMPTLDFYWLMDETSYKPMAGPLKDGVRKRLQFTG